jgi:hypothetical protein
MHLQLKGIPGKAQVAMARFWDEWQGGRVIK